MIQIQQLARRSTDGGVQSLHESPTRSYSLTVDHDFFIDAIERAMASIDIPNSWYLDPLEQFTIETSQTQAGDGPDLVVITLELRP